MTNRTHLAAAALSALVALGGAGGPALAGPGSLTISGSATGSADNVAFSAQPFTAVATFRWSDDLVPANQPLASYPASLNFTLGGAGPWAGTYASQPGDQIFAVLLQPAFTGNGTYGIELQDAAAGTVGAFFSAETPDPAQQSLLLSGLTGFFQSGAFVVPLAPGGVLDVTGFDSLNATALLDVPEPATLGLLGFAVAALGFLRNGERQGAEGRRVFRPCWCYKEPQWRRMHMQRRTSTERHAVR